VKSLLLILVASLCFGASESRLSLASLKAVEASINDRVRSNINDPYDLLGPARGTYLEGYGVVFTVEMNLVVVSPLNVSPFHAGPTEKELTEMHDRKARKAALLKGTMRDLMTAAACKTLTGLPPEERIVMQAFLFNYGWEQTRGLPHRIMLTARKQKLMDALNKHLTGPEFAALFDEEEM
jgi:hypothetical protein